MNTGVMEGGGLTASYVEAFEQSALNRNQAPQWLADSRRNGIEAFAAAGFPRTRHEEWRFTSLARLAEAEFKLVEVSGAGAEPHVEPLLGASAHLIVFVNGHFVPALSSVRGLPAGAVLTGQSVALREFPERLGEQFSRVLPPPDSPLVALNSAFTTDGCVLLLPRNVRIDDPIQILHITDPGEASMAHPRHLLMLEDGASATVVESYVTKGQARYWTNTVTEAALGENARLTVYRLQDESTAAYHTALTRSHQQRGSSYKLAVVAQGSELSRHDITAVLDGEGAECRLYGLSHLQGRQHVDHHTTIDHAKPHCNSWEYFNGIYDDRSRGVFTGRIVVRPGAQRTDSKQTNNSLLLSEHARADSQPQLEIYADDVKCTHGATLGPIDDRALFYLRTRGITADDARALLTYGFGSEILDEIDLPDLQAELVRRFRSRLARANSA